jgi:Putative 2OG-Fe(II) oxygenase
MNAVAPLFSTPIYIGEVQITNEEREHCASLPKSEGSFSNFLISHDDKVLDDQILCNLKNQALGHLNQYVDGVYRVRHDTFDFYINTSWVSDVVYDTAVGPHRHCHSIFTGVIVLESSDVSRLILDNPQTPIIPGFFNFRYEEFNPYNSIDWYFDLKPNQIYLFPSNLNHSAKCITSHGKLTTIAFDTFVRGTVGKHSDRLTFQ